MKRSLVFDTLLKALGSSFLGASGCSFLEEWLVIEPMRLSAVVFSLRVLCLCGLKTYPNALSAYNLWTKGMLLRCLRITEKYKLKCMKQTRMSRNQILKKIQSLSTERRVMSTERVLDDLAGLFVHLCRLIRMAATFLAKNAKKPHK